MKISTDEYAKLLTSFYRSKFLLTYITKDILANPDNVISEMDLKYLKTRMTKLNESISEYEKIK